MPGWVEAKEAWPGGCQSWVTATCRKRLASALTSGTIASPSATASAPPGMKSACMSTTSRTSSSSIVIPDGMRATSSDRHQRAPAAPLKDKNDAEREYERQDQVEEAKNEQPGHDIGLGRVGHALQEGDFQDAETARGVADERQRERGEEDAKHSEKPGIGLRRQGEEDDAGGADEFEGTGKQLPRRDFRARVDEREAAQPKRAEVEERADDEKRGGENKHRAARLAEPFGSAGQTLDKFGVDEKEKAGERHRAKREGERAEGDQDADLAGAQPLGRIGAISDDGAGEDGGADVVGDGVGREGRQRHKPPAHWPFEVHKRDPVVPGERRVCERGGDEGQNPARQRDRIERVGEARERQSMQFPEQKPRGHGHRADADHRPSDVLNPPHPLHAVPAVGLRFAPTLPARP